MDNLLKSYNMIKLKDVCVGRAALALMSTLREIPSIHVMAECNP